jgi:hypothetical protein
MLPSFEDRGARYLNHMPTCQQKRTTRAGWALGLFAMVWLNLAVQPCAMAFGIQSAANACGHCPLLADHAAGHQVDVGNTSQQIFAHDGSCLLGSASNYSVDSRDGQGTCKDSLKPASAPFVIAATEEISPTHDSINIGLDGIDSPPALDTQALNILYCRYLI